MENVYVIGIGMTRFGRFFDQTIKSMTAEAVTRALNDAGIKQEEIGAAFFGNAGQSFLEGQHMVPGQIALRDMGFEYTPITNVENACASSSTAFHLAFANVKAGLNDIALAVGAEKMCFEDKSKGFAVFDGAWDVTTAEQTAATLEYLGENVKPPEDRAERANQRSLFMDVYSNLAKFHMNTYGTTEKHLAIIASKNHKHSSYNPLAQYQNEMSVKEVLGSRMISWPLTIAMCAPISDGAAAAVVCNEAGLEKLRKAGVDIERAIVIKASIVGGGTNREPERLDQQICKLAADRAYEAAGLGPSDMSFAEVHDASAFAEVQQSENLGFCEYGQGGWIAEKGETTIGGRIPINPSGGLECKGHPIGATGIGQIHEMVTQLRHEANGRQVENARFAIAENGGGFYRCEEAVACVTILGRKDA
ncbi:thiolase family protein [Sneathiella sp. HT1-7]|uniref:thiolase family protein n=1 Tax=Sneathiella sp. HT1-7 TaxID=2887192 RepID=UPI001D145BA3|nr:thiolase family protein [Sneathiella sp. HT1-7]MCC3306203.1 thiolase family protein [Sneathiella sp. HT1-7]